MKVLSVILGCRSDRKKQLVIDFLYNGLVSHVNWIGISYTEGKEVRKSEGKAGVVTLISGWGLITALSSVLLKIAKKKIKCVSEP